MLGYNVISAKCEKLPGVNGYYGMKTNSKLRTLCSVKISLKLTIRVFKVIFPIGETLL